MALRQSVIDAFPVFSEKFEGKIATMYADIRGLITTAIGCLIDPLPSALALKWRFADGGLAPSSQISEEWNRLKSCAAQAAHHSPATQVQMCDLTLHLDDDEIARVVTERMLQNAALAPRYFPKFDTFPADAQLGIMSLAWAAGAGFAVKFPHFTACVNVGDWSGAATAGQLSTATPEGVINAGVIPRNSAQVICFANAAAVIAHSLDPDVLYWPNFPSPPVNA